MSRIGATSPSVPYSHSSRPNQKLDAYLESSLRTFLSSSPRSVWYVGSNDGAGVSASLKAPGMSVDIANPASSQSHAKNAEKGGDLEKERRKELSKREKHGV